MEGEELKQAATDYIKNRAEDTRRFDSLGTTRRLTDLIGSLSDLTSGSGDKGTQSLIQGYFDDFSEM